MYASILRSNNWCLLLRLIWRTDKTNASVAVKAVITEHQKFQMRHLMEFPAYRHIQSFQLFHPWKEGYHRC